MSQESTTISFVAAVPQFTVPDLVRTAEYYRDVLGFQIAGYWDGERVSLVADTPPVFAIVWVHTNRSNRAAVALYEATGGRSDPREDDTIFEYSGSGLSEDPA